MHLMRHDSRNAENSILNHTFSLRFGLNSLQVGYLLDFNPVEPGPAELLVVWLVLFYDVVSFNLDVGFLQCDLYDLVAC